MISFMAFVLLWLASFYVTAAPHPLTGSSWINNPASGFALNPMGFALDSVPEAWVYNKSLLHEPEMIEVGLPNKTVLSFRSEKVSTKTQLETYVRQYLRDYNQYGFEVVGLQSHKKAAVPSVIVDLKQKNKAILSRQVFFHNGDKVIIATCADEAERFQNTVATCNRVLGSFRWQ